MKKILMLTIALLLCITVSAQSPQYFKYQAVARDGSGNVLKNQNVSFQISILKGSASGSLVFRERHFPTTNQFGLVNLTIGAGTNISGDLTSIDWGDDDYFFQIELDPNGGTSFTTMGTSQLFSVPYALYANSAGNINNSDTSAINEIQLLSISGDTLQLSKSNYVVLQKALMVNIPV
jgi:hypothetical protein